MSRVNYTPEYHWSGIELMTKKEMYYGGGDLKSLDDDETTSGGMYWHIGSFPYIRIPFVIIDFVFDTPFTCSEIRLFPVSNFGPDYIRYSIDGGESTKVEIVGESQPVIQVGKSVEKRIRVQIDTSGGTYKQGTHSVTYMGLYAVHFYA